MIYPHLDLRAVSFVAGLWLIVTHGLALLRPAALQGMLKRFPRSKAAGVVLLVIDAVWAFLLIANMDLGEFTYLRTWLLGLIVAATFLTMRYVDEFLAVRALGMLLLLAAEPLVEAGFLQPQHGRVLVVLLAYAWAILGMFWIGMPYLLRDQIDFFRKSKPAWSAAALGGIVYGGLLLVAGMTGI